MSQGEKLVIRPFEPADAGQISDLFTHVYGQRYVYPEVYLPSLIGQRNASGHWRSIVAEQQDVIVGHAALVIESPHARCAELAMMVVTPTAIGRGIGIRLARALCGHARQWGMEMVVAMLVSSHSQTQRMAAPLGFVTTGLLIDYLPSPYAIGTRETYVLTCLPLQPRPLPDIVWPRAAWPWIEDIVAPLGTCRSMPGLPGPEGRPALEVRSDGELVVLTINEVNARVLAEIARLPRHCCRVARLRVCHALDAASRSLWSAGYRHCGLMPAADGGWYWLMQAGFTTRSLRLHCHHASRIFAAAHEHGPHA
ncbi:GNAT family N-acetyltransferase [Herbaspirillum sp. YR522]|uniref:GNAT family N-acetyltransferase n=1 Tax=Herbaspirillum sp. YR522 TaxID=1144342 RepID=UPI00026F5403|nr:GNAT family N-acetyltransferase [Herbaspirillum sp. YR522]EJM97487.1 sortase-like acyltransferase [Herbaspirillum sp. YR522]